MFSVSRTPISDMWLSSVPSMPVENKSLEPSKRVMMEKGRLSTTSVNSELFPELMSWSAIIDFTQRSASLPQPIPSDVSEEDEVDTTTVNERHASISLSRIFDPTTLAVGFDLSCFDGLDDRLIYTPKEAFVDCCWSECMTAPSLEIVHDVEAEICSTPTPSSPNRDDRRRSLLEWSSDESDSDSEECSTTRGSVDIETVDLRNAPHFSSLYPIADLPPYESLYWNQDKKPELLISSPFEPLRGTELSDSAGYFHFPTQQQSDPSDSVGYFPIPAHHQSKKLPRRLACLLQFGKRPMS